MTALNFPNWLDWPAFDPKPHQDAELLNQLQYVPGLQEILTLRQVHALEHATVWVLGEQRSQQASEPQTIESAADDYGGMSTDQGFYLYGPVDTATLKRAVQIALQRLVQGDWSLAVHPRCGTNLSVGMVLTVGFALGFHLLLPKGPIEQLAGLGVATAAAAHLAPELGSLVQRHVTTAIPFNLAVDAVVSIPDHTAQPAHFVRVHWIN
jgi:hypothetical protein